MSIRKKIFLLAGILLTLFGVVVGVLATFQKLDGDQIGNIVAYELPLSRLVAQFDVDTDRYELNILRVLWLDPASPEQLQATVSAKQALADELRSDVATASTLLEQAVKDSRYDAVDRVDLARIEGSFKYLSRGLEEFLALGDLTMARLLMAGARTRGRLRSASRNSRRRSVRTSPRFAVPLPISPIGRLAWSSPGNGSTPI
jgi:adenylate cyclase